MEHPSIGTPPAGSIRFNTDSKQMELYNGDQWWEMDSTSPEVQTGGTRGLFAGGRTPSDTDQIQYINIATTGNGTDFGNLSAAKRGIGGCSDRTRGLFGGGNPVTNVIDYVTITSTGNASDFGDLTVERDYLAGGNSSTRGIFAGGLSPANHNTIDYVTIASTGNAVDFGDIALQARQVDDTVESPTRCVLVAGIKQGPYVAYNYLEYITTSTTGNTADFGDLTGGVRYGIGSFSNAVRGVMGGGDVYPSPGRVNIIDYITIATLGNSSDFGDQTYTQHYCTGTGSSTRGVFAGGNNPSLNNGMSYVQIMTTGNAIDFGDLNDELDTMTGCSNDNGGLG